MKDFGVPTGKITAIRTYATDSKRVEEASKSEKKQVLQSPVAPKVPTPSRTPMSQTSTQEVALEKSVVPTPPPTSAVPTPSSTTAEKRESPTVQPSKNTTPAGHEQVQTPPKESVVTLVATEDKKTVGVVTQTTTPATKPETRSIASELASEIEAGSFVTDRKHSRPSFSEIMRSAFSEWWGTTRDSVETTVAAMPLPTPKVKPTIAPTTERTEVIKEAAQLTNQVPRDDHRVVVQKVKATTPLKKETSKRSFTVKKQQAAPTAVWGSLVASVDTEKETRAAIAKPAPTLRTQTLDLRTHISAHDTVTVAPKKFWGFNLLKPTPVHNVTKPKETEQSPQNAEVRTPTQTVSATPDETAASKPPTEIDPSFLGPIPYQHIDRTPHTETPSKNIVPHAHTLPDPVTPPPSTARENPPQQTPVIITPKRAPLLRLRETPLPRPQETMRPPLSSSSPVDTLVVPPMHHATPEAAPHAIYDTTYSEIAASQPTPVTPLRAPTATPRAEERHIETAQVTKEKSLPPQTPKPPRTTARAGKKVLEILLYGLIILFGASLGIGTAYIFYTNTRTSEVPIENASPSIAPSVILADSQETLPLTTIHSDLMTALTAKKTTDTVQVAEYVFTETGTPNGPLVPGATIMDILAPNAPSAFVRSVSRHIIFGSVLTDTREPFIILEAHNFDVAFAGMLAWERMMSTDLAPLFGTPIPETESQFTDALSVNKSIRILYGKNGEDKLMYAFINGSYICITTSTKALSLIIERLR